MGHVLMLDDPRTTDVGLVGGKGANLGRLVAGGFTVPGGFTVVTDCYVDAVAGAGLDALVAALDHDDPVALAGAAEQIRKAMLAQPFPVPAAAAVLAAYRALGDDVPVAVRSSGTAEDLADASFAGLHDTFLHVRGEQELLVAVQRCWASLWSDRAIVYRHRNGFPHEEARIAVVVQRMVDAEVSGVMFTGNPITTATDEIVVNASWGLGEAIVSGAVTPDLFVLGALDLEVRERTLGAKEHRIDRDPATGVGTVRRAVDSGERARYCLDEETLRRVARLGLKIQDHYDGFPQDVEWAVVDGRPHVLQSRPVTGVEFSWDADLELEWPTTVAHDELWTRAFADELSTGAISPIMYSYRYLGMGRSFRKMGAQLGVPGLQERNSFKFYKGEVYFNCRMQRDLVERTTIPQLRPMTLAMVPEQWHAEILATPFDPVAYAKTWLRAAVMERDVLGRGIAKWLAVLREHPDMHGKTYEQLADLSDRELKTYLEHQHELEFAWNDKCFLGFLVHFRDALAGLAWIVGNWYTGDNPNVFTELMAGSTESTATQVENSRLWELARALRTEPELRSLFERSTGPEVFTDLEHTESGRRWLADYHTFLAEYGHRGHTDRDVVYPRRIEDPAIDYRTFLFLIRDDNPVHPHEREAQVNRKREATYDAVLDNIRRAPLGALKAEAFKLAYRYTHELVLVRDNERCRPTDIVTMSYKRGFIEMGRRLAERGHLEAFDDVYFLSRLEAYALLDGDTRRLALTRAKVTARRRDFDRFHTKQWSPPMYLRGYAPVPEAAPVAADGGGPLIGMSTAPGQTTAVARVVHSLEDIGKVGPGEILVTNSTDPGWTPVFLILGGVVVETGGLLSHSSCLAREYGFPAVQLAGATRSIPDGAAVTMNGSTGTVTVLGSG
jgi:rifampicin phosphotransferase